MNFNWFTRKGIVYWPASTLGWLILLTGGVYTIYLFVDIDSRSHSVSDTLISWGFNCLIVGVIYSLIGFFTEKKKID